MSLRSFSEYLLAHRLRTAVLAFFVTLLVPFGGNLGSLVAAFVTLRKDALEGSWVFVSVILAGILQYFLYMHSPNANTVLGSIITWIGFAGNLLLWGLALLLRRSAHASLSVEVAALIGVAAVLLVHILVPDIATFWNVFLTGMVNKANIQWQTLAAGGGAGIPTLAEQRAVIAMISRNITGFLITAFLLGTLLQLLVAAWWEAAVFMPGSLRRQLYSIHMGYVLLALGVLAAVLAISGIAWAKDIVHVLEMAFFLAGLSMLHAMLARSSRGWRGLALTYLVLIVGEFWNVGVLIIAFVGLIDAVVDFRQKT